MPDHPIIFSAPMIRALLAGRKTQTRRIARRKTTTDPTSKTTYGLRPSPWQRVKPGDRLWVRESVRADEHDEEDIVGVRYLADDLWMPLPNTDLWRERHYILNAYRSDDPDLTGGKIVPPIHMPRWASRLTLTVTEVRVQPLWLLTRADAMAEGCPLEDTALGASPREWFCALWDSLHGPCAWNANPEVVALTFTVAQRNIDA